MPFRRRRPYDVYIRGLRQPMRVMEAVWPLTALYLGVLG